MLKIQIPFRWNQIVKFKKCKITSKRSIYFNKFCKNQSYMEIHDYRMQLNVSKISKEGYHLMETIDILSGIDTYRNIFATVDNGFYIQKDNNGIKKSVIKKIVYSEEDRIIYAKDTNL